MLIVMHRVTTKGKKKKNSTEKEISKDQNSTLGEKNNKINQ